MITDNVISRITELKRICYDEGDIYSEDSLKDLLSFLETNTIIKPNLVVTPAGNFRSTWKDEYYSQFSIEFFGSGIMLNTVRFYGKIFSFRSKILEDN